MAFRDDTDALLHRTSALQRELDEARTDEVAADDKIAELERRLAAANVERDRLEEKVAKLTPAQEPDPAATKRSGGAFSVAVLLGALVLAGIVVFAMARSPSQPAPVVSPEQAAEMVRRNVARQQEEIAAVCTKACANQKRCTTKNRVVCPTMCRVNPRAHEYVCASKATGCEAVLACFK